MRRPSGTSLGGVNIDESSMFFTGTWVLSPSLSLSLAQACICDSAHQCAQRTSSHSN
jgi:hypothetical protein